MNNDIKCKTKSKGKGKSKSKARGARENNKVADLDSLGSESIEQQKVFAWAEKVIYLYHDIDTMYHIPNEGKRSFYTGNKLKKEGLKKGVADICLPVPSGKYIGLYIEMKYGNNKVTKEQLDFLYRMQALGHAVKVCYSAEEAINTIIKYYELSTYQTNNCKSCRNTSKKDNCANCDEGKKYCKYIKDEPNSQQCNCCSFYVPVRFYCEKCGNKIIIN